MFDISIDPDGDLLGAVVGLPKLTHHGAKLFQRQVGDWPQRRVRVERRRCGWNLEQSSHV
jgi:hypothetical protein